MGEFCSCDKRDWSSMGISGRANKGSYIMEIQWDSVGTPLRSSFNCHIIEVGIKIFTESLK